MLFISFFFIVAVAHKSVADHGGIPTKEEQVKLIKNIEDIFSEIKSLVIEEGVATDTAVIQDTQRMVDRAVEYLTIIEDYATLKTSCISPNTDCSNVKESIQKIIKEGEIKLQNCVEEAANAIYNNSQAVTGATEMAVNSGHLLLETLNKCAKKPALHQISCYKKSITEITPLKVVLVDCMQTHKSGHMETFVIRSKSHDCIDTVLSNSHNRVADILNTVPKNCI